MTIAVKAKKSGTISNTAAVTTTVVDGVLTNNEDTEATVVNKKAKAPKGPEKPKGQSCAAPTITGTSGNDSITGTRRNDVIVSQGGNDGILAGDGKDLICAGGGADLVSVAPRTTS